MSFFDVAELLLSLIIVVVVVVSLVFFTSLMGHIRRHLLTCMCWAQKFGILIFAMFLFSFGGLLCFFFCFSRAFSLDFVVEFPQRKLVLYRVARGEGGGGNAGWGMRVEAARLRLKQLSLSLCAWVGVWLRFVYVHLSGFNVHISRKKKEVYFSTSFRFGFCGFLPLLYDYVRYSLRINYLHNMPNLCYSILYILLLQV